MRTEVIPAYPYSIYKNDDNISTFFKGYNEYSQQYVDFFVNLFLPVYDSKSGSFLDWVGRNIYGIRRPVFPVGLQEQRGDLNTIAFDEMELNKLLTLYPANYILASDDVYKRVIKWHHWKGDDGIFNIQTLKQRVMRFLSGWDVIQQTYQVSVSFGAGNQVNLIIYNTGRRNLNPSAVVNNSEFSRIALNEQPTEQLSVTPLDLAEIFKIAVETGALELPFQFDWQITIN